MCGSETKDIFSMYIFLCSCPHICVHIEIKSPAFQGDKKHPKLNKKTTVLKFKRQQMVEIVWTRVCKNMSEQMK